MQPAMSQNDLRITEDTLKEWETQVNDEGTYGDYVTLGITPASLVIRDPRTGEDDAREVNIIHINEDHSIYPVDERGAQHLGLTIAPELHCNDEVDEDVVIDIIKPLCQEAGMDDWVEQIFSLKERKDIVKAIQKVLNEGKPDPDVRVRVMNDRTIKFRGQVMTDARIKAIVTVPPQRVDPLIARSGQSGIIVEHANRDRNDAYHKIKMPLESSVSDCNTAISSLPPQLRKKVRGLIPSARGFMVRTKPEDHVEVMRQLNPDLATELGPALGIQPNSLWLIKGLPKRISKQDITAMLAASAGPWTGWYVIPKHVVSDNPGKWSSWVVEAEEPPPARAFKTRGNYATIQRHVNEKAMHPAARVWAKPISQLEREGKGSQKNSRPRTPWGTEGQTECDVDHEGDDGGDHDHPCGDDRREANATDDQCQQEQQNDGWPSTTTAATWRTTRQHAWRQRGGQREEPSQVNAAAPTPWMCNLTESEGTDTSGQPRGKRRFGETARRVQKPWPSAEVSGGLADQERAALRAEIASKDAQIASLQASLNKLQTMMEAMMGAMAANGFMNAVSPPNGVTPQPTQASQPQSAPTAAAASDAVNGGSPRGVPARPNWHDTTEMEDQANGEPQL